MNADPKQKSTPLDVTTRASIAALHGLFLVVFLYFVVYTIPIFQQSFYGYLLLPGASFIIGFILNTVLQQYVCGKLNIVQISLNSLFAPALVAVFSFLLYFIPFLLTPLNDVLPNSLDLVIKSVLSKGFYMFWAGLYGQTIASGFVQACN
jgi:hypothetical protein